jgi:hypothetical protein
MDEDDIEALCLKAEQQMAKIIAQEFKGARDAQLRAEVAARRIWIAVEGMIDTFSRRLTQQREN